jgi:hypothetical protein
MCVCVCTHTHTRTHKTHPCMHQRARTHTQTPTHTHMHACMHNHAHAHAHTHTASFTHGLLLVGSWLSLPSLSSASNSQAHISQITRAPRPPPLTSLLPFPGQTSSSPPRKRWRAFLYTSTTPQVADRPLLPTPAW